MRAHFLIEGEGGRALTGDSLDPAALALEGVFNTRIAPESWESAVDEVMRMRGYRTRDEVRLSPQTEGLDAILGRFDREHSHTDDEVRYVLAGEGIFDIRARDDRWMRVVVGPGDLIVVPRDRHHRFFLGAERTIHAVRLFEDQAGWVPHYR